MTNEEKNTLQSLLKMYIEEQEGKKSEDAASIVEDIFNGKNTVEEAEEKFSVTENGALAYKTSGKVFVDFIFNLNSFRKAEGVDLEKLIDRFIECYKENRELAWKMLFYIGDVRGGAGERKAFFECLKALIIEAQYRETKEMSHEIACMLKFIPEYTRWDIAIKVFDFVHRDGNNSIIYSNVVYMIHNQLVEDVANAIAGNPISLLAKWMPSINATSVETRRLAKKVMVEICQYSNDASGEKNYRKMLSMLRANLKVVEKSMTANEWSEIDYSAVPSKASLNLRNAFKNHDPERYGAYINAVSEGRAKINVSVTEPHEIVSKILITSWRRGITTNLPKDPTLVQIWNNLSAIVDVSNTIVVADTSGSMSTVCSGNNVTCLDVALGLAVFTAERLSGPFHNKFITFASRPNFITLHDGDIYDKLNGIPMLIDNTNIEAVFDLLAQAYATCKARKTDMPKNILILSDMQFDKARTGGEDEEVLFKTIKRKWDKKTSGEVPMPKLIFWNLDSKVRNTIPVTENESGLILMSGFSTNMLKMAMSGQFDPFEALLETLNSPRYEKIGYEYTCSTYDNVL